MRQNMPAVIVGKRALLRKGLASFLQRTPYKVIADATNASELKGARIPRRRQTLVLLQTDGSDSPVEEVAESMRQLRSFFSDCSIVVVAENSNLTAMQRVMALVPDGYILNLGSGDILLKALELTFLGQRVFVLGSHNGLEPLERDAAADLCGVADIKGGLVAHKSLLSQREQQILAHLSRGNSNKAIARFCNITESTVKVHLKAILRKTEARNRTQAAIWAVANGLGNAPAVLSPLVQADSFPVRSSKPTPRSAVPVSSLCSPTLPQNPKVPGKAAQGQ